MLHVSAYEHKAQAETRRTRRKNRNFILFSYARTELEIIIQFILILIDYNPNSRLLQPATLQALPFANQIKIFQTGFGMWQQNVRPLA
jgi:hypothetical protein